MKTLFLTIFILTILSLSNFTSQEPQDCFDKDCNPHDKAVLFKIKQYFGNPYTLASWKSDFNCCCWYGVQCTESSNSVNSLVIQYGDDIIGTIPSYVGYLPHLKSLELHKLPNLTGNIPPAITKLKELEFLRLDWLNLTGEIPSFLGSLKKLNYLRLSFNSFSGSIPSSLGSLPNLNGLFLDRNKLTGQIPESFGELKNDTYISLSHNQLSGKIPSSLGNVDFGSLDLSRNKLEGDASFLFGANKKTQTLDLSRNLLEFNFTKVEIPKTLSNLDINHNKIYGSIPEGITKVVSLQSLNVSYNRLCGKIPVGGNLERFDSTTYFHNKCLCGAPLQNCK